MGGQDEKKRVRREGAKEQSAGQRGNMLMVWEGRLVGCSSACGGCRDGICCFVGVGLCADSKQIERVRESRKIEA